MPASAELAGFIRSHFRSVWALELLLYLKGHADRSWAKDELVRVFRASQSVVGTSLDNLLAGGLVVVDESGSARYGPASEALERLIEDTAILYAKKPNTVRRLIVAPGGDISAFADAFRLRRD